MAAMAHFEMDCEWRYFLAEHAGTEAGHGWGYIRQANAITDLIIVEGYDGPQP